MSKVNVLQTNLSFSVYAIILLYYVYQYINVYVAVVQLGSLIYYMSCL